mgnify:CR=1 FL=1
MTLSTGETIVIDGFDFEAAAGHERFPRAHGFLTALLRGVLLLLLCLLLTLVLGWQATHLKLNASFEKTIPTHHPYVQNMLAHETDLSGLGNAVRIAVANPRGDIYDARYLDTLRRLSDEVFLLPGVARMQMKSLWTPATRWVGVTEDGLEGGPVIPDGYDGGPASLQQLLLTRRKLRQNRHGIPTHSR